MEGTREQFKGRSIFSIEGFGGTYQSVSFTAASASSAALNVGRTDGTTYVILYATQDCHIRFTSGSSTALITDTFLPANIQTPFYILPGHIISVIRSSLDGTLSISPAV